MVAVVMGTGVVVVGVVLVVVVVVVAVLQSGLSHIHFGNEHVLFLLHDILRHVLKHIGIDDCLSAVKRRSKRIRLYNAMHAFVL